MNGQWIGTYSGTNTGTLVADLDDVGTSYAGMVFVYDNNSSYPRTAAQVELPKNQSRVSLRAPLLHIQRGNGEVLSRETLAQRFPGIRTPEYADTEWEIAPTRILLKWMSDIGTTGVGEMARSEGASPSTLPARADVKSWDDFKKFVLTLDPYRFAFRGHGNNAWRLRTSFHRTGRASLMRYQLQDVPALHRHLSGLTSHRFNLADPLDHAAFLSLVQHHGYPTPVLDWTQSPFVAAYFSFKDLSKINLGADEKVRIFIFDSKTWANTFERAGMLMPGFSHVTILEPLATNNPRALPQQSLSSVTNVDDLEQHIRKVEEITATSFLTAIDLPASDRRTVMQDLALMGITAGSLFPGIDGACLQLKERFSTFDHGGILVRVTTNSRAALPSLRQHQSVGWVESFTRPNNPERCDVLGLAIGSTQPTHYKRYMALLPQAGAHPVSRDAESPGEMQDFRHLAARVMHCPPALTSPAPPRSAAISART